MTAADVTPAASPAGRTRRRWRLWPATLTGRFAVLLMLCLLVGGGASVGFYIHDRAQATIRLFAESVAGRIEAIVALMDRTPPAERAALLPALNSPTLLIRFGDDGDNTEFGRWQRLPRVARLVEHYLPTLSDRILDVRAQDDWRRRHWRRLDSRERNGDMPDLFPSRRKVLVSVALADGSPIRFVVASDTTSFRWAAGVGFWMLVAMAFIAVFSFWAARRLTRPLRRFAAAADQLGMDVRAPPLPEQGSREIRNAVGAFNRMQARIRRLVDDRTMMLAAISHDLRTMLTRLRLRAEFIDDAEQQRKAVDDIDEMQKMLESTLSFARDDNEIEGRTEIDLAALLQSLVDDLADAGRTAAYSGPDRLPYRGAPVSLKRAFANLMENAAKYGGESDVAVAERPGAIEVTFSDRGPGIPPDMREKVFQPFFRVEPSRSRETGGMGLGLSVARSIVRRHGGDITIEDREGGGLRLRVVLPRNDPT